MIIENAGRKEGEMKGGKGIKWKKEKDGCF